MKKLDVNLKVLIAIIIVLGLSLPLMAQQQQKEYHMKQGENDRFGMLDLSEEQKAEMKEIRLEKHKVIQPLKDELQINKAKINALVKKDNPDMKEIVNLVEANGKILTQIRVKEIESKVKVRGILDEEQKVIFDAHYGRMQQRKTMAHHRKQVSPQRYHARMHNKIR
jgi:Spy/CpxP family protein refolding chaperone